MQYILLILGKKSKQTLAECTGLRNSFKNVGTFVKNKFFFRKNIVFPDIKSLKKITASAEACHTNGNVTKSLRHRKCNIFNNPVTIIRWYFCNLLKIIITCRWQEWSSWRLTIGFCIWSGIFFLSEVRKNFCFNKKCARLTIVGICVY